VIDCWRLLPRRKFEAVAHYVTLGLGVEREQPKATLEDGETLAKAQVQGD
jgi:hypothetical protein